MKAAPDNFLHRATLATFMCYASDCKPAERMAAHADVARAVEAVPVDRRSPPMTEASNPRDPDRPLRVAYLSPDFLTHSVSYFFEPIVERGSGGFVPHCYFASQTRDATDGSAGEACAGGEGGGGAICPNPMRR